MATDPDIRHRPSIGSMVVWVIFCLVMWAWAITGPLAVVMVTIALTLEPEWLGSVGETPREKMLNLQVGVVLGAVGLAFVWLRLRGYLKFGDRD
jgi:succinate-acetate transporter protein